MIKINQQSNYLAKVVVLENFKKHTNADKLICWNIDWNWVITDPSYQIGDVCIYFPVNCQINQDFLKALNVFRDPLLNRDTTIKGYFKETGRVEATNLRQEKSQGFLLKVQFLNEFLQKEIDWTPYISQEFDEVCDIIICKKWVLKDEKKIHLSNPSSRPKQKELRQMIPGQFQFHDDTENLGKNLLKLDPFKVTTISEKLHGSSAILANVLINKDLTLLEKIAKWFNVPVVQTQWAGIFSSGKPKNKTPKGIVLDKKLLKNSNVWADNYFWNFHKVEPGITLYGEIVGDITQAGWDYSHLLQNRPPESFISKKVCKIDRKPFSNGKIYDTLLQITGETVHMECGEVLSKDTIRWALWGFYVYRITKTDSFNKVIEFTWDQMTEYCNRMDLQTVPLLWQGTLKEWVLQNTKTALIDASHFEPADWLKAFMAGIMPLIEKPCPYSLEPNPSEGIIVRQDFPNRIFKLKSHSFLIAEGKKPKEALETNEPLEDDPSDEA